MESLETAEQLPTDAQSLPGQPYNKKPAALHWLRNLIQQIEADEVDVDAFIRHNCIEETQPKDGWKTYGPTGHQWWMISFRRNGPRGGYQTS